MCTLAVYKGGHGECLVNLLCKSLKHFGFEIHQQGLLDLLPGHLEHLWHHQWFHPKANQKYWPSISCWEIVLPCFAGICSYYAYSSWVKAKGYGSAVFECLLCVCFVSYTGGWPQGTFLYTYQDWLPHRSWKERAYAEVRGQEARTKKNGDICINTSVQEFQKKKNKTENTAATLFFTGRLAMWRKTPRMCRS